MERDCLQFYLIFALRERNPTWFELFGEIVPLFDENDSGHGIDM